MTWIIGIARWIAGTRAGQIVGAVVAALMGAMLLRAKWRGDGARDQQAKQAADAVKVGEKVNEAGAAFRADGAADRLRDGRF
jgi:predicted acylesterase/phospholipase RssA